MMIRLGLVDCQCQRTQNQVTAFQRVMFEDLQPEPEAFEKFEQ